MSLKKGFIQDTEKVIWKIIHDNDAELLLIENREATSAETSFSLFDLVSNEEVFSDLYFEETWWISVSALNESHIVFHTYDDHQNPSIKSSFAYDYRKNEVTWQKENLTVTNIDQSTAFGNFKNEDTIEPIAIDLHTGEITSLTPSIRDQAKKAVYPIIYHPESEAYNDVKEYLETEQNAKPISNIEYLEYMNYIFVSYYENNNSNGLKHQLVVLDRDGTLLLHETLDEQLKGVAQDSFYILADYLIYIRKKTEICKYAL